MNIETWEDRKLCLTHPLDLLPNPFLSITLSKDAQLTQSYTFPKSNLNTKVSLLPLLTSSTTSLATKAASKIFLPPYKSTLRRSLSITHYQSQSRMYNLRHNLIQASDQTCGLRSLSLMERSFFGVRDSKNWINAFATDPITESVKLIESSP